MYPCRGTLDSTRPPRDWSIIEGETMVRKNVKYIQ